jgi:hypothetical protein
MLCLYRRLLGRGQFSSLAGKGSLGGPAPPLVASRGCYVRGEGKGVGGGGAGALCNPKVRVSPRLGGEVGRSRQEEGLETLVAPPPAPSLLAVLDREKVTFAPPPSLSGGEAPNPRLALNRLGSRLAGWGAWVSHRWAPSLPTSRPTPGPSPWPPAGLSPPPPSGPSSSLQLIWPVILTVRLG